MISLLCDWEKETFFQGKGCTASTRQKRAEQVRIRSRHGDLVSNLRSDNEVQH
jgi:hypothetical protein